MAFIEKKGVNLQTRFLGYARKDIKHLGEFIQTLQVRGVCLVKKKTVEESRMAHWSLTVRFPFGWVCSWFLSSSSGTLFSPSSNWTIIAKLQYGLYAWYFLFCAICPSLTPRFRTSKCWPNVRMVLLRVRYGTDNLAKVKDDENWSAPKWVFPPQYPARNFRALSSCSFDQNTVAVSILLSNVMAMLDVNIVFLRYM